MDGKHVFDVSNDGWGGPNLYMPVGSAKHEDWNRINSEAAKQLNMSEDDDALDVYVNRLIDIRNLTKDIEKGIKKGCFVFADGVDLQQTTKPIPTNLIESVKEFWAKKQPDWILLNFMEINKAVDIVMKARDAEAQEWEAKILALKTTKN